MKIVVMGAGVIGTLAAYYLARDGHEVTLVDQHDAVAKGTSQSNAGLVSPGDATAWASPAALKTFVKSLYTPGMGIKVRPGLDPYFLRWVQRFLFQCTTTRSRANTDIKLRLALYSRTCINEVSQATGVDYDQRSKGIVYFFRSQQSLDHGTGNLRYLAEHGLKIEVLDRDRLIEVEPGLAGAKDKIAGAVYSPMDQTGDSGMFTTKLAEYCCETLRLTLRLNTRIEGLEVEGNRVAAIQTASGRITADAFVLAMGPESGLLGRKYGIDLPIYPVKGYTATLPLPDASTGPTMGGVDEDKLIAYSRLGNRLRLASTAEFAGFDRSHRPGDFTALFQTAEELFGVKIDPAKAVLWAGLRPMMPNSVPVIGRARFENLYLNTGHGHVGWTLAAGSGKFLSDMVANRTTDIDPAGLIYRN